MVPNSSDSPSAEASAASPRPAAIPASGPSQRLRAAAHALRVDFRGHAGQADRQRSEGGDPDLLEHRSLLANFTRYRVFDAL